MSLFITSKEKKNLLDQQAALERYLMGIDPIPEDSGNGSMSNPHKNKKWAFIIVNGERTIAWVDNVTMKAYEADGYDYTDREIPEFTFERWCRLHDL